MRRLVILANAFPFGNWEPFLMTELKYLKGFDAVDIMALSVREHQARVRRSLPEGRFTVSMVRFRPKWFYLINSWRAFVDINLYRELGDLWRRKQLSPRNVITLVVFLTRAHYEAARVLAHLNRLGATNSDSVLFYSYRFFYQPYLAHILQKSYPTSVSVAKAHGADLYIEHSPTKYLPLREYTVSILDRIYCVAEHGRRYLEELVPASAEKVTVSRLGTHDYGYHFDTSSRTEALRIVTCSTLTSVKRIHLVVEALSLVDFNVEWDHYGEGPLYEDIKGLAGSVLGPNVKARFQGFVPNAEVIHRYVSDPVHLLLNVSESEGVPVSIMEALSTATPVAATDVGGSGEIISNRVNGFLLDVDCRPEEIALVLEHVRMMSAEAYLDLRKAARQVWLDKCQAEFCYRQFSDEINGLLR